MQTKETLQVGRTSGRKRIVNFRFFLFTAVFLCLSIFIAHLFFINIVFSIILISVLVSALLSYCISVAFRGETIKTIALIVSILAGVIAYCVFISENNNWHPRNFRDGRTYSVSGSVDSNVVRDGARIIVLDNISLDGNAAKGKIRVYFGEADGIMEFAKEGDKVSFRSRVTGSEISVNYRKNERFYASINQSDATLIFGKPTFLQSLRRQIKKALTDNLSEDYAEITYSMLTGDKNTLPNDTANYFRVSGLAHTLAVSGLHINFVMLLLMKPLQKIKANKWFMFSLVVLVLVGYIIIADFSPSVIRASIMGIVGLATSLSGRPRDALNNLCLALTVILVVRPHFMFDIGFLMSVFAVLGIVLFARPITAFLEKIKFPRFLAQLLAVVFAAQLGILPVTIFFFRTVSLYSFIANILLAYVIMVTFMLAFVGVFLTILLPFMGFIIKLSGLGMFAIDGVAQFVATLPLAKLVVFTLIPIFLCYFMYFVASRFVRKKKAASLISGICLLFCLALTLTLNYSHSIRNIIVPVSTALYDVTSVVTVDEKVYVVGDVNSAIDVTNTLITMRARKIDAVFVSRLNEKIAHQVIKLSYSYDNFTLYFPLTADISGIHLLIGKVEIYGVDESTLILDGMHSEFSNGKFLCYRLENAGAVALFIPLSIDPQNIPVSLVKSAGIMRSHATFYTFSGISMPNVVDDTSVSKDTLKMSPSKSLIYNYATNKVTEITMYS